MFLGMFDEYITNISSIFAYSYHSCFIALLLFLFQWTSQNLINRFHFCW